MDPICVLGRGNDGMLLSYSLTEYERDRSSKELRTILKHATLLLRYQDDMPEVLSIESGSNVFHYEKGPEISCIVITDQSYSVTEAFSRLDNVRKTFLSLYSKEEINDAYTDFTEFDCKSVLEEPLEEELPLSILHKRGNIAPILDKIRGTTFGFSSKILEDKKRAPDLSWAEIGLLVPLTMIGFIKTIIAMRTGHLLDVFTNLMSTGVAFYLVFICVHKLLTLKKLFSSSFILLLLTYGTTLDSLPSIIFNGIFALVTLCNVGHYYLKREQKSERARA